jgi:hypothetical protein
MRDGRTVELSMQEVDFALWSLLDDSSPKGATSLRAQLTHERTRHQSEPLDLTHSEETALLAALNAPRD